MQPRTGSHLQRIMNDTGCPVQVPGFTHNGDCNLLCKPTEWKDVLTFFLGNYAAHVATVVGRPGQSSLSWFFSLVLALCFPGAGVLSAIQSITSMALFAPTELTKAVRAGALCVVVPAEPKAACQGGDEEASAMASAEPLSPSPQRSLTESIQASTRLAEAESSGEAIVVESQQPHQDNIVELEAPQRGCTGSSDHHQVIRTEETGAENVSQATQRLPVGEDISPRNDTIPSIPAAEQECMIYPRLSRGMGNDEYLPPALAATQVHGISRLPAGYRLLVLPPWTQFVDDPEEESRQQGEKSDGTIPATAARSFKKRLAAPFKRQYKAKSSIPCSYNAIKVLVSLGQLVYAALTLYDTRGNQIEMFGYAAFGLTVAPYIWMSFVNLLANLLCPQYSNLFVVNSPSLDDLRKKVAESGSDHQYTFDGTVGRIDGEMEERVTKWGSVALKTPSAFHMFFEMLDNANSSERVTVILRSYEAYAVSAVPIAIVGALSRFRPGISAPFQRVWTMLWLCLGPMAGAGLGTVILSLLESRPVLWRTILAANEGDSAKIAAKTHNNEAAQAREGKESRNINNRDKKLQIFSVSLVAAFLLAYMTPAIGGFVVVAQMLGQYGTCIKMDRRE